MGELRTGWDLLWYGGIAITLLIALWLLLRGDVIPRIHHVAVVDELRKATGRAEVDRDEWKQHAKTLSTAVDRLTDTLQVRGRP